MTDQLAVVVPTFNRRRSLERLLDAIPDATAGIEVELVVVDDGSTDGTFEMLSRRHGVVAVRQDRGGPAAARNRGWRRASSPYVCFIDDDCIPQAGSLHHLAQACRDGRALGARIEPLGHPGLIERFAHHEWLARHKVIDGQVRYLVTAGAVYPRASLEALGGFDERFPSAAGEDVDLFARFTAAGGEARIVESAVILHDYRSSLRQLLRTYYRHGLSQGTLLAADEGRASDLRRSARDRVDPRDWSAAYRRYRVRETRVNAAACLGLRATCMVPWLTGAVTARHADADSSETLTRG